MRAPLLFGLVALALVAPVQAQDPGSQETARERWSRMDDGERAEMRRRFDRFKSMDESERAELNHRMKLLRGLERSARERLPETARTELDQLGAQKRDEIVRELTQEEIEHRGKDLLERMPAEWRERLESAPPSERKRVLKEFREEHRGPSMSRAFDAIGEELALSALDVERMKSLPESEREEALLDLRRRSLERRIETRGLPEWLSEEEWASMQRASSRDFHSQLHAKRRAAGERGFRGFDRRGPSGSGTAAGPGAGRTAAEDPRQPEGDGARLRRLMSAEPEWRVELRELSPQDRRAAIEERIKERTLGFLEHRGGVEPAELARLRELEGRDFFDAVRGMHGSARPGDRAGPRRADQKGRPARRPGGKLDAQPGGAPGGRSGDRPDGERGDRPRGERSRGGDGARGGDGRRGV